LRASAMSLLPCRKQRGLSHSWRVALSRPPGTPRPHGHSRHRRPPVAATVKLGHRRWLRCGDVRCRRCAHGHYRRRRVVHTPSAADASPSAAVAGGPRWQARVGTCRTLLSSAGPTHNRHRPDGRPSSADAPPNFAATVRGCGPPPDRLTGRHCRVRTAAEVAPRTVGPGGELGARLGAGRYLTAPARIRAPATSPGPIVGGACGGSAVVAAPAGACATAAAARESADAPPPPRRVGQRRRQRGHGAAAAWSGGGVGGPDPRAGDGDGDGVDAPSAPRPRGAAACAVRSLGA